MNQDNLCFKLPTKTTLIIAIEYSLRERSGSRESLNTDRSTNCCGFCDSINYMAISIEYVLKPYPKHNFTK